MSYTPRSGVGGTARINGTELPVTAWQVSPKADIVEFRNSLSGRHPRRAATYVDGGRFTITVDWDDSNNLFSAPLTIHAGDVVTDVTLNLDGPGGSLCWRFPSAVVDSTPQSVAVEGKITTTLSCLADGAFAAPGQSVS